MRGYFASLTLGLLAICAPAQQTAPVLSLESAYDGQAGPFLRTEQVRVRITGGSPFTPVSILVGLPIQPVPVPGALGTLHLNPTGAIPLAGVDGFQAFGGSLPLHLDGLGTASLVFSIPPGFASPTPPALPHSLMVQALARPLPYPDPTQPLGGFAFALTNPALLTVTEPQSSPVVSGVLVVDAAFAPLPSVVLEGTTPLAIIRGTGFLPEASVLPTVTVESLSVPGLAGTATVLALVDEDPSPTVTVPALLVRLPASPGGLLTPPATTAGEVRVRVSYGSTLYPINPGQGTGATFPPHAPTDPRRLIYRSTSTPSIAAVSPRAMEILSPTACLPLLLSGNGFLLGAEMAIGGITLPPSTYNVLSQNLIQVTAVPPALPVGLHKIFVRNVDEQISPEVGGSALLGVFQLDLAAVAITGTDRPTFLEGTLGATVTIDGTCPSLAAVVNGLTETLSLLDPAIGPVLLNLGSEIQGSVVTLPAPLSPVVTILAPGVFRMQAPMPPFPPGLANLPAGSQGGLTNTGLKHWQITPAFCVNPPALPHRFPSPGTTEPNNRVNYMASAAPSVLGFEPTDHGRVSGGQFILIRGSDFLSNASTLPSTNIALIPVVLFADAMGFLPPFPAQSVEMLDAQTLRVQTPNLTSLGPALPYLSNVRVFNPDLQASPAAFASRYTFLADLVPTVSDPFVPPLPGALLDLVTDVPSPRAWTFLGDLEIPSGATVRARGSAPVFIRVRGDFRLDGQIDISGASFGGNTGLGPAPGPAGAGVGGAPIGIGLFGAPGTHPLVVPTAVPMGTGNPATGGEHGPAGGGAGGAGLALAGRAGTISSAGRLGGLPGQLLDGDPIPLPTGTHFGTPPSFRPTGGPGGATGGFGVPMLPLTGAEPPASLARGGAGGHGGGGLILVVEGHCTIDGTIDASGEGGGAGSIQGLLAGGGGGGGTGGILTIIALQGITVGPNAVILAQGGTGGSGGSTGVVAGGSGGDGTPGAIRLLPPAGALGPQVLVIDSGALVKPTPDTSGFPTSGL